MTRLSPFAESIFRRTYAFTDTETWEGCARRVAKTVADNPEQEEAFYQIIRDRIFVPGGRILYTAGRPIFQASNCFGLIPDDSREGWASTLYDAVMCLSMGGGVGINYSALRERGAPITRMGGTSSGPVALMEMVNSVGRSVMAGGTRRSALWAGLTWTHPDIQEFITKKDWSPEIMQFKRKDFNFPAPLDQTNVSVIIGNRYIDELRSGNQSTWKLHLQICELMARTGEPAFRNQSRILEDDPGGYGGNPCQETILHHRDVCLLGSIVLSRIRDLNHMEEVTRRATQFLINASIRGHYPTEAIARVAKINRRIGLGLMGIHEFMLLNGHRYEWFPYLEKMLSVWKEASDDEAATYAIKIGEAKPIARRAIAPNGTISIIAETTSGIEPIFCAAYKRRYIDRDRHRYQYVIDPTVKRLLDLGINPKIIEDTYDLAKDFRRRLEVQAQVQRFVDMAISSTVNLPAYGSDGNDNPRKFAEILVEYLPRLKGITFYPDGSRPGQPITKVPIDEARDAQGIIYEENMAACRGSVCGV